MKTLTNKKAGPNLGFKSPGFIKRPSIVGMKKSAVNSFNPSRFKTQHKG